MDFMDAYNTIDNHMGGISWSLTGFVTFPDLTEFVKQDTDMDIFPVEYVYQTGCADYGYHGTIFFPTDYPNGDGGVIHVRIDFADY